MANWNKLLIAAYAKFHEHIESAAPDFPGLTKYDIIDRVSKAEGSFAWGFSIPYEIQQNINISNDWGMRLHQWHIWMRVVETFPDENEKWEIWNHFLEPIAFSCMFHPSGLSDRLLELGQNMLHQANQSIHLEEPDRLDQDNLDPGRYLSRKNAKKQMDRLGERWATYPEFSRAWSALNDREFKALTRNYRNRSAHSLAPRFQLGDIPMASRSIVPWEDLIKQSDGSFIKAAHPTKKSVSYAFGVILPISFQEAHAASLSEYRKALQAMQALIALVDELCSEIDRADLERFDSNQVKPGAIDNPSSSYTRSGYEK